MVVCEHLDGWLSVYYGPHRVGRYASVDGEQKAAAKSCGKTLRLEIANNAGFPLSHSSSNNSLYCSTEEKEKPKASGHITCQ